MKEKKYYIIGGIILAGLTFLGIKAFAKPKVPAAPKPPKKRGQVIVDEPTGGFTLPAEVTTRIGTRLRQSASTNSSILYTYQKATILGVLDDSMQNDGQWFKVTDGSRTGWVRSDVVDFQVTGGSSSVGSSSSDYEDYSSDCPAWYGDVCA